ncbi:LysR family transcriptional regulator [Brenneria goodwinii]|uniref:LysR family transcriptional regulator n=1 Tax=Brenneria goodwinii TaxID=1109412 RepID=UPI000EF1DBAD|nr:LysR family transcriptional regulator [Brenneria goodwinii]MCG8157929.1 LysR family transcriptional regulator [Brenneria goodwinii]MCG8163556.1 LysR family transcriptional regulator [Brenneria goodwinii]MCG8168113.1 LysR family transcriptional regulator [Brenneria goodwinii]MCG8172692.1 LysR family transcriptional regulator [Brenneria goodwinii]MCG8177396.1 LysR family transcriptional regulator [Brenneria goodwinii]
MRYSPESLLAFIATVNTGSFSAAARHLRKSQSTISSAIANLEADLGLRLFDRAGHQPILTPAGKKILAHVQAILSASEALDELAIRLADNIEPRLTFVLSDTWKTMHYEPVLQRFAQRFPDIEFECLIAEYDDVIDLLQSQRAHVGLVRAQSTYPPDIAVARSQIKTEMAVFVAATHPLATEKKVTRSRLATVRQLYLNTYKRNNRLQAEGVVWSAPSYLMLLEMAEQGFGWSILPRWLVSQFGHQNLVELAVAGWPQLIDVDIAWSKRYPPGPAGLWMIDNLLAQQENGAASPAKPGSMQ